VNILPVLLTLNSFSAASPPNIAITSWQNAAVFSVPTEDDSKVKAIIEGYLKELKSKGFNPAEQGLVIESQWGQLANVKADEPISAASLTKIVTTLAAIEKLGLDHQFTTTVQHTGQFKNGVLEGDLVIVGDRDPLFTWEEAISLASALQKLGIKKIQGNLLIVGNFYMNFQTNTKISGDNLKKSFNWHLWPHPLLTQYNSNPAKKLYKPALVVQGQVKVLPAIPPDSKLILRHKSLPLLAIIKQMNIYSNNYIAQILADSVGGINVVVQTVESLAQISPKEIQLVNGSGLGDKNRISPYAICQIWSTLEKFLAGQSLKIADLFPVSGVDKEGTLRRRHIPAGIPMKTGTLNSVSALAGVIPTQENGPVCFAILNHGNGIAQLRHEQDLVLQRLSKHWQILVDHNLKPVKPFLGDPTRNI